MDGLAATVPRVPPWSDESVLRLARIRAHARALALTAAVVLAASFRTMSLWTYGFSDDEINKVNAIAEYRAGTLSAGYVNGDTVTHHGYMFLHRLYVTDVPISTVGVPAGFYLYFLATRIPILLLIAAAAGLAETARRRGERGFVFLRVMFVFLLLGYSLLAVKFVRYILPLLAILDICAAVGVMAAFRWIRGLRIGGASRLAACATLAGTIVAVLLSAQVAAT